MAQGYDFIKTYNQLPKEIFDVVIKEAKKHQVKIVAHPSFKVPYKYHFKSEISTIEHTEDIYQQFLKYEIDSLKIPDLAKAYAKANQSHSPTLSVFKRLVDIYNKEDLSNSFDAPYMNSLIKQFGKSDIKFHDARSNNAKNVARMNEQHKFHLYIIGEMHKAGVNLVASTDSGILYTAAGFSIHKELKYYQEAGMTNFEALSTATINPSKVNKLFSSIGTIEKGKKADLIISKENPIKNLSTLKNPEFVMVNGRLLNASLLKKFEKKGQNKSNYLVTLFRLLKFQYFDKY